MASLALWPATGNAFARIASSRHRTLFHLPGCGHVAVTRPFNRDTVADARCQPVRHHSVPVRAHLRRRKSPGRVPFVLIDDDVDRSRHLLADFEYMFDRRQFIEFSAEDHEWTAKIGNPRSQIET